MDKDEGIGHYQQGHWDVAAGHFAKALKVDPTSAAAHYNLGLTQDKMGKHDEATASFKQALELASNYTTIKESEILKARRDVGLPGRGRTVLEREGCPLKLMVHPVSRDTECH
jgi:tetratricopeptide (TPR) repeat protein